MSYINNSLRLHYLKNCVLCTKMRRKTIKWQNSLVLSWRCFASNSVSDNESLKNKGEKFRDISGLNAELKNKMDCTLDDSVRYMTQINQEAQIQHESSIYAIYGRESGIKPGVMWPTEDEVKEKIKDENEWEPTLESMLQQIMQQRNSEEQEKIEKEKLVESQMKKMPEYILKLKEHLKKVEAKEEADRIKSLQMLEMAEEFYGFKVNKHDPRYKQFVESKLEEKKREQKQSRKLKQT